MIYVHWVKEEDLIVILWHMIVWVWQAYCERRESAPERRTALYKSGQQQPSWSAAVTGGMYMGVASLLSDHRVVLRWLVECIWVWQACYLTITWYCGDWWNVYGCDMPAIWPSRGTAVTGGMYMGVTCLLSDHHVVLRWLVECIWVWHACCLTIVWYCGDWWTVHVCDKPHWGMNAMCLIWQQCWVSRGTTGGAPLLCLSLKVLFKFEASV